MALNLAQHGSSSPMRIEDLQRLMLQRRSISKDRNNVSYAVINSQRTKTKLTARKSTHVLKTDGEKIAFNSEHNLSEYASKGTHILPFVIHPKTNVSFHKHASNTLEILSKTLDSELLKSKKTENLSPEREKSHALHFDNSSSCFSPKIKDDSLRSFNYPHHGKGPPVKEYSEANQAHPGIIAGISIKETLKQIKGSLGVVLKAKKKPDASSFSTSNNSAHILVNNSNTYSPNTEKLKLSCSLSKDISDSNCNEKLGTNGTTEHNDCSNESTQKCSNSLSGNAENEQRILLQKSEPVLHSEQKTYPEIYPHKSSILESQSPSRIEELPSFETSSPDSLNGSGDSNDFLITNEETESEEGLNLWLDETSCDSVISDKEKFENSDTMSCNMAESAVGIKNQKDELSDIPPLLCLSTDNTMEEIPSSPEMPVLSPVQDINDTTVISNFDINDTPRRTLSENVNLKEQKELKFSKMPQVILRPLSSSLLKQYSLSTSSSDNTGRITRSRTKLQTFCKKSLKTTEKETKFGLPEIIIIDGIEFLSFETEAALNEFTINDQKRKPLKNDLIETDDFDVALIDPVDSCKTSSKYVKPIIPTKTDDITKIKGWRNKIFDSETTPASDNFDLEEIKKIHWTKRIHLCHLSRSVRKKNGDILNIVKRRRLRLRANRFTKKKMHIKHQNCLEKDKISTINTGTNFKVEDTSQLCDNTENKNNKKSPIFESKILDEFLENHSQLNVPKLCQSSVDVSSLNTFEMRNSSSFVNNEEYINMRIKQKKKIPDINAKNETEAMENHTVAPGELKKYSSSQKVKRKVGRPRKNPMSSFNADSSVPFKTPYGWFQKFESVFLPVGSVTDPKPTFHPEIDNKFCKNSVKCNLETINEEQAKIAVSAVNFNEKPKQLDFKNVISENLKPKVKNSKTSVALTPVSVCGELFCRFGCICDSLKVRKRKRGHCGKVQCMFKCICTLGMDTGIKRGISDGFVDTTLIMTDDGPIKRKRATRLPARLKDSAFLWNNKGKEFLVDPEVEAIIKNTRKPKQENKELKFDVKSNCKSICKNNGSENSSNSNHKQCNNKLRVPPIRITNLQGKYSFPMIASSTKPVKPIKPVTVDGRLNNSVTTSRVSPLNCLPFGPASVNGNVMIDSSFNSYTARALISIEHTLKGSFLKFIGIHPDTLNKSDPIHNEDKINHLDSLKSKASILYKPEIFRNGNRNSHTTFKPKSFLKICDDKHSYLNNSQIQYPFSSTKEINSTSSSTLESTNINSQKSDSFLSNKQKGLLIIGYLISKTALKEAACLANTSNSIVSVPVSISRAHFLPFSHQTNEAQTPVFGVYAVQGYSSYAFVGPFQLSALNNSPVTIHSDTTNSKTVSDDKNIVSSKEQFQIFSKSFSHDKENEMEKEDQEICSLRGKISDNSVVCFKGNEEIVREVKNILSRLINKICLNKHINSHKTSKQICASTKILSKSVSTVNNSSVTLESSCSHTDLKPPVEDRNLFSTINVGKISKPVYSVSNYNSDLKLKCKPLKVVLNKLTLCDLNSVAVHKDVHSTPSSEVNKTRPRLLAAEEVAPMAWKKNLEIKKRREQLRRNDLVKGLKQLSIILDPTKEKKPTRWSGCKNLLEKARSCIRELESHSQMMERYKETLICQRLKLFGYYISLLNALPSDKRKDDIGKLRKMLMACCKVRDNRAKVQTTWEPDLRDDEDEIPQKSGRTTDSSLSSYSSSGSENSNSSACISDKCVDKETISDFSNSSNSYNFSDITGLSLSSDRISSLPVELSNNNSPVFSSTSFSSSSKACHKYDNSFPPEISAEGSDTFQIKNISQNEIFIPSVLNNNFQNQHLEPYLSSKFSSEMDKTFLSNSTDHSYHTLWNSDFSFNSNELHAFVNSFKFKLLNINLTDNCNTDVLQCEPVWKRINCAVQTEDTVSNRKTDPTTNGQEKSDHAFLSYSSVINVDDDDMHNSEYIRDEPLCNSENLMENSVSSALGNINNSICDNKISSVHDISLELTSSLDEASNNSATEFIVLSPVESSALKVSQTLPVIAEDSLVDLSKSEGNTQDCFDEIILPSEETVEQFTNLPKIIACSSISEAEFLSNDCF